MYYLPKAFGFTNSGKEIYSITISNIFAEEWPHSERVSLESEN